MNKMLGCLMLIMLGYNACDKDNAVKNYIADHHISKTWKYIGYSGGLAGFKFTPQPDVNNYLQFDTTTFHYILYSGTSACGTFSVEADTSSTERFFLTLDGAGVAHPQKYDAYFLHDTLSLYPHQFADAFASYYIPDSKHFEGCDSVQNK